MDDLRAFYVERYREADRLFQSPHGVLERVRTQELLLRHLPSPPASVLDVGGGTGVHAAWLAARGYDVSLVDLIDEHVAQATVPARVGDARSLEEADASQDAVLLLGPLYHLLKRSDRQTALAEARRVVSHGAPVIAAGICRYATLMDVGADGRLSAELVPVVEHLHETGEFPGSAGLGFTATYFHRPEELRGELIEAGLRDVTVFGIEGPAASALDARDLDVLGEYLDAAVRAARLVETDPALIAASGHLLAVGWR